jgi:cytochrome oxidase Cu insertion factor (SCO1/SenC/PrrC family)
VSATVLGLLSLLLAVGSGIFWFRLAFAVRLPENRSAFVLVWAASALLGVIALAQGTGWIVGIPAGLAIALGVFFLFTVMISPQQAAPDAIAVGETLRDFSAPDENGETFELASAAGRPLLLKFFRGHW